jgi:5'-3' exonuclease
MNASSSSRTNIALFKEICSKMERLRNDIRPVKKLVLCVDGVAGCGKMYQQRQRRFKTGLTMDVNGFNPNSFTPGTKLMDHLTKYVDWYIRNMMTNSRAWQDLEVVFSNEKVPGEGEHKIMQYFRVYGNPSENICVYGLDADLIMIGLLLPLSNVYVAREPEYGFIEYIHLEVLKTNLLNMMRWPMVEGAAPFEPKTALQDFILMSFLVGNDFLPTLPTVTILDGALDMVLEIYLGMGGKMGHLTAVDPSTNQIVFRRESMLVFFREFSSREKELIELKYNSQHAFFPDPLVLRNLRIHNQKNVVHFEKYRTDYYKAKFWGPRKSTTTIVSEYLDGMNWILNYYKNGIPDWTWFYPYFYGPFLTDFPEVLQTYESRPFQLHDPVDPFLQLMMVLPENSKSLIPGTLGNVSTHLKKYFPDVIEIDLTGKRKEWEGVVILPIIQLEDFVQYYKEHEHTIHTVDRKRNIRGKNFLYRFNPMKRDHFSSFYGNIYDCPVVTTILNF